MDLTKGNIYSLSKETIKIIKKLEDPIIIRAYITKNLPFPYNTRSKYTQDILAEYKAKSGGKIKFKLISPEKREEMMEAQRAGVYPLQFTEVKAASYGVKQGFMGICLFYGDKKEVIPIIENIGTLEYDITSRIKKLISKEKKHIVFTKGHDEIELDERIKNKLSEQYIISSVNIDSENIPIDASCLVILGPKKQLSDTTINKIKEFINEGKAVGFFIDKVNVNLERFWAFKLNTGIEKLLNEYNIKLKDGLVLDLQNQVIGLSMQSGFFVMQNFVPYPFLPKSTNFDKSNPIVRELESVVFPFTTAIDGGKPIVKSSKRSWIRQNVFSVNPMEEYLPMPNEEKGPFNLAVVLDTPRIFVAGTAKFVEPNFSSESNLAFFFNAIDWLAQDVELMAIRGKEVEDRPLKSVSQGIAKTIRWINILLPTICLISIGMIRWNRRKRIKYEI